MESNTYRSLKRDVLTSLAWLSLFKYSGQIITWIITIYVIRILNPADYGTMAQSYVFIGFLSMLSEFGIGAALVQADKIDKQLLKEFFGFVLVINGMLTVIVWITAPLVASYFQNPLLIKIYRVLSISFVLSGLYSLPLSLILRDMKFKFKSKIDFIASICSALTTLAFALKGYGVWSLIYGFLINHVVFAIGYNLNDKIVIFPTLSFKNIKKLISFGSYLTGSKMLWYFYSQADIIVAGRIFSSTLLGFYSVAMNLASLPLEKFFPIVNQVAFPAYSSIQSDIQSVQRHLLKSIRLISVLLFPVFIGLVAIAPKLIIVVLGDQWSKVILPFQLLCLIMPMRGLRSLFSPVMNGIGKPKIEFYNVLIASILMPLCFVVGVHWGVGGLSSAWLGGYFLVFFITSNRCLKAVNLDMMDLITAIKIPLILSAFMFFSLWVLDGYFLFYCSTIMQLVILIVTGSIVYLLLLLLFGRRLLLEVKCMLLGDK